MGSDPVGLQIEVTVGASKEARWAWWGVTVLLLSSSLVALWFWKGSVDQERSLKDEYFEFVGGIAHDLRSPIAALKVMVHGEGRESGDSAELARATLRRVEGLTKRLRSMSASPPSGDSRATLQQVLQQVVDEKRRLYAGRTDAEVSCQLDADVAVSPGVSLELSRVASNLLNNSIEASGEVFDVRLQASADRHWLTLRVFDRGSGFPDQVLKSKGVLPISVRKPGGTGMGLSHARKVATALGGGLTVANRGGGGALVELTVAISRLASG